MHILPCLHLQQVAAYDLPHAWWVGHPDHDPGPTGDTLNSRAFFTNRKVVFLLASLCCLLWGSAYPAIKNGYALFGIAPGDIP